MSHAPDERDDADDVEEVRQYFQQLRESGEEERTSLESTQQHWPAAVVLLIGLVVFWVGLRVLQRLLQ